MHFIFSHDNAGTASRNAFSASKETLGENLKQSWGYTMNTSLRWVALFFVLGMCAAYSLWGRPRDLPANSGGPNGNYMQVEPVAVSDLKPAHTVTNLIASKTVRINPATLDFGELALKERKVLTAQVENTGTSIVKITHVQPSCSCIKAEMAVREIAPGRSETLSVTYFADSDRSATGLVVTLTTNEPGDPKAQVRVTGKVKREFLIDPPVVAFGKVIKGTPKTIDVVMQQADGKPFTLKGIQTQAKEFSFKWTVVEGSRGSAYKISATILGNEGKHITEDAAVVTDFSNIPASLPMYAEIIPDVVVTPNSLHSSLGTDNKVAPFELTVTRVTPGELKIESFIEAESWPVEVQEERIDDRTIKLRVTLTGEYKKATFGGQFLLKTSVERTPMKIAYFITVQPPKPLTKP
jgi:hypothetical protein